MNYWILLLTSLTLYLIPCLSLLFNIKSLSHQAARTFIGLGLFAHATFIYTTTFTQGINLDFSNTFLIITWVIVSFFWIINKRTTLNGLEFFTLAPTILIILLHPFIYQEHYVAQHLSIQAISHILIAMVSYGLLTFGAIFSFFLLLFENNLHNHSLSPKILSSDESLLSMEIILFKIYWIGFLLLTITLISGLIFSNNIFGSALVWNHKLIFSIMAWLIYAWMLIGRILYGWRGKKAVTISLVAFIFLFLSYLGTKFVLEILLSQ